jgi:hypothetical protein
METTITNKLTLNAAHQEVEGSSETLTKNQKKGEKNLRELTSIPFFHNMLANIKQNSSHMRALLQSTLLASTG